MSIAVATAIIVAVIGLQTYWISRSIDRVDLRVDEVKIDLNAFKAQNHTDMQAHTTAITDLRERVAKVEP